MKNNDLSLQPQIEIIPERSAICSDTATEMHIMVRITAPQPEVQRGRPPLNISIALDRSGSMSGAKLRAAKAAASFAIQQLQPCDRVSVTIYDSVVETIVPSTLVTDKQKILRAIERVEARSATALHAGWVEGATQVSQFLSKDGLNRVLLLTDGLANEGETDPNRIAADVCGLAQRGVTTSTLGVGNDYNEDLLEAMAINGDGAYYFVEGAADLERIFASELQGLMATLGKTVSLGIEPQNGTALRDVLNDLTSNNFGRLQLPNLVAGNRIDIIAKLHIPAQTNAGDICSFRLAWSAPSQSERQKVRVHFTLPSVSASQWHDLPKDERVTSQVELMNVTRVRQQAVDAMERGEVQEALTFLSTAKAAVVVSAAPWAPGEVEELNQLASDLEEGNHAHAMKMSKHAIYQKRRGR